jgi:hypothetical protein
MKEACRMEAETAKKASKPAPVCKTADDIVIAYEQTNREKIACTRALGRWWKKQQEAEAIADGLVPDGKHPRSGRPARAEGAARL